MCAAHATSGELDPFGATTQVPVDAPSVERIEAPDWDRFRRDYVARGKPVLITGVADRWRACSHWTPEYLKQTAGDAVVEVAYHEDGDHGVGHSYFREAVTRMGWRAAMRAIAPQGGQRKNLTLGELLDRLTADPPDTRCFLHTCNLDVVLPQLLPDLDHDGWVRQQPGVRPLIFLGRDTFTAQHYHGAEESLVSLIVGKKRVMMFSPDQIPLLHPYPWHTPMLNLSQLDVRAPDYRRFPRFRRAKPIIVDMVPGDMLFIPVQWFHSVKSFGLALGLTWFWEARLREYNFPTPSLQMFANRFFAPLTIGMNIRKTLRFLRHRVFVRRRPR